MFGKLAVLKHKLDSRHKVFQARDSETERLENARAEETKLIEEKRRRVIEENEQRKLEKKERMMRAF